MQRTPSHRNIYSKIIHMQLNTMKINHQWGTSTTPNCTVCCNTPESWQHVLSCKHTNMRKVKSAQLAHMHTDLITFKTYPPLIDFILEFFEKSTFEPPEEPVIAHPLSSQLFHYAYREQNQIGWNHLAWGLISSRWRHLQQIHLQRIKSKDIHALNKWARAFIETILEYNRVL